MGNEAVPGGIYGGYGQTSIAIPHNTSRLIYKKMSEVMKDIGSIAKDKKNEAQGFKFRGIDQFVNALYPALTKHGVFMAPRAVEYKQELKDVVRSNGKQAVDKHVSILMEYTFYAEDGSLVTIGPIPAEALDSGDKATNKALSAALKYCLIQTFSIPTEDMPDGDSDTPVISGSANPKVEGTVSKTTIVEQAVGTKKVDFAAAAVKANGSFKKAQAPKEAPVNDDSGWD